MGLCQLFFLKSMRGGYFLFYPIQKLIIFYLYFFSIFIVFYDPSPTNRNLFYQ